MTMNHNYVPTSSSSSSSRPSKTILVAGGGKSSKTRTSSGGLRKCGNGTIMAVAGFVLGFLVGVGFQSMVRSEQQIAIQEMVIRLREDLMTANNFHNNNNNNNKSNDNNKDLHQQDCCVCDDSGGNVPLMSADTTSNGALYKQVVTTTSSAQETTTTSSGAGGSIIYDPHRFITTTMTDIRGLKDCHSTLGRGYEVVFNSLMAGIHRELGFLSPNGSVLDVGAQYGEQSCLYGSIAPLRHIHAVDPSYHNQWHTNHSFHNIVPNLHLTQAGMGKEIGFMTARDSSFNMRVGAQIPVITMDSLFFDKGESLAFAHIDVEGMELDVLHGGVKTIRTDRPIFTTELRVHQNATYTRALVNFINHDLQYDTYVINEVCGGPFMDYRNLLNIPREISEHLVHSDIFNLALSSETIFLVDSDSISKLVYPCCIPGGECCPNGDVNDRKGTCCMEHIVFQYYRDRKIHIPIAFRGWMKTRKHFQRIWYQMEVRANSTTIHNKN